MILWHLVASIAPESSQIRAESRCDARGSSDIHGGSNARGGNKVKTLPLAVKREYMERTTFVLGIVVVMFRQLLPIDLYCPLQIDRRDVGSEVPIILALGDEHYDGQEAYRETREAITLSLKLIGPIEQVHDA